MTTNPRWPTDANPDRAAGYAARFAALAADGVDIHGEANFCAALVEPGARVLDAGCGTGRVAIRLAQLGYVCLGVDNDEHMLAQARAASDLVEWAADDHITPQWAQADLAGLADAPELADSGIAHAFDLAGTFDLAGAFDLVVAAGNVVPLVAPGTEAAVIAQLAAALAPGGMFVSGFGLDAAHLPLREAPFGLDEYESWCDAAGLALEQRFATWAGAPYDGGGYVVNVHRQI